MNTAKKHDPYDDFDFTDFIPDVFRAEKIRASFVGNIPDLYTPVNQGQNPVMVKAWKILVWDELLHVWLGTPFVMTGETKEEALAAFDKDNRYVQLEYRIWRYHYQIVIETHHVVVERSKP